MPSSGRNIVNREMRVRPSVYVPVYLLLLSIPGGCFRAVGGLVATGVAYLLISR